MTQDAYIRNLDKAICECPRCKGECDKSKLCAKCLAIQRVIEQMEAKRERA